MGADLLLATVEFPTDPTTGGPDYSGWAAGARSRAASLLDDDIDYLAEGAGIPSREEMDEGWSDGMWRAYCRKRIEDAIEFVNGGGDRNCVVLMAHNEWLFIAGLTSWGDGCDALDHVSVLDGFGLI